MKKSLLTEATKIVKEKLSYHKELSWFPHFTFIIQDNRIVECGQNHTGTLPVHYGYGKDDPTFRPKIHSEVDAYKKARGLLGKKDFEIINVRMNKKEEFRNSCPCPICFNFMVALGCKKFYYSMPTGFSKII